MIRVFLGFALISLFCSTSSYANDQQVTLHLSKKSVRKVFQTLVDLEAVVRTDPSSVYAHLGIESVRIRQAVVDTQAANEFYLGRCKGISIVDPVSFETTCTLQIGKLYVDNVIITVTDKESYFENSKSKFNSIVAGFRLTPDDDQICWAELQAGKTCN